MSLGVMRRYKATWRESLRSILRSLKRSLSRMSLPPMSKWGW